MTVMPTLLMQCVVAVLAVVFTVVAAGVARARTYLPDAHRVAWIVVTTDFGWRATLLVVQNAWAVWAFMAGQGTPVYTFFLRWGPAMNEGRSFVAVTAAWGLAALSLLKRLPVSRLWVGCSAAALGVLGVGAYLGGVLGGMSGFHFTFVALLNAVELIGLLLTLLLGLYRYTLDRYLWLCLCVYAFHLALNVAWLSWTVGFFSDGWYPSQVSSQYYAALTYVAAIALARRRRALARTGARVTSLLELPSPQRQATLG